ncbi:uncharacterized protein LOC134285629 [Aedes albopictus]|uniref:C2H2-type domain-containing protein n=1 Tax=Aedes albopictus TaxID=7160 RepID=A0ABM2A1K5_AEDAL
MSAMTPCSRNKTVRKIDPMSADWEDDFSASLHSARAGDCGTYSRPASYDRTQMTRSCTPASKTTTNRYRFDLVSLRLQQLKAERAIQLRELEAERRAIQQERSAIQAKYRLLEKQLTLQRNVSKSSSRSTAMSAMGSEKQQASSNGREHTPVAYNEGKVIPYGPVGHISLKQVESEVQPIKQSTRSRLLATRVDSLPDRPQSNGVQQRYNRVFPKVVNDENNNLPSILATPSRSNHTTNSTAPGTFMQFEVKLYQYQKVLDQSCQPSCVTEQCKPGSNISGYIRSLSNREKNSIGKLSLVINGACFSKECPIHHKQPRRSIFRIEWGDQALLLWMNPVKIKLQPDTGQGARMFAQLASVTYNLISSHWNKRRNVPTLMISGLDDDVQQHTIIYAATAKLLFRFWKFTITITLPGWFHYSDNFSRDECVECSRSLSNGWTNHLGVKHQSLKAETDFRGSLVLRRMPRNLSVNKRTNIKSSFTIVQIACKELVCDCMGSIKHVGGMALGYANVPREMLQKKEVPLKQCQGNSYTIHDDRYHRQQLADPNRFLQRSASRPVQLVGGMRIGEALIPYGTAVRTKESHKSAVAESVMELGDLGYLPTRLKHNHDHEHLLGWKAHHHKQSIFIASEILTDDGKKARKEKLYGRHVHVKNLVVLYSSAINYIISIERKDHTANDFQLLIENFSINLLLTTFNSDEESLLSTDYGLSILPLPRPVLVVPWCVSGVHKIRIAIEGTILHQCDKHSLVKATTINGLYRFKQRREELDAQNIKLFCWNPGNPQRYDDSKSSAFDRLGDKHQHSVVCRVGNPTDREEWCRNNNYWLKFGNRRGDNGRDNRPLTNPSGQFNFKQ